MPVLYFLRNLQVVPIKSYINTAPLGYNPDDVTVDVPSVFIAAQPTQTVLPSIEHDTLAPKFWLLVVSEFALVSLFTPLLITPGDAVVALNNIQPTPSDTYL